MSQSPEDLVRAQLFERRIVLVTGPVDDVMASDVAAQLMALGAAGDEPIELRLDSPGGTLDAAFVVIDTIGLSRSPVQAMCAGRAEGAAVGVFAAAVFRRAAPHARFRLCQPEESVDGTAANLESWVEQKQRRLDDFHRHLAQATGRPFEVVEADTDRGRYLDAEEAVRYGLVHEIGAR
jgi:ATP-dependent Clp protease protease subunit